ncbi:MAG: GNAT family N-acetyltransferase, partial [Nocardioides sp.]|nr:GNAT family N-acetyltransferase [Nocardioides sp.]
MSVAPSPAADRFQPSRPAADVLLANGSIAVIRGLLPEDREALDELHEHASDDSIRFRFFAPSRTAGHDYVARMFSDDKAPVECLVATLGERLVAVATAEATPGGDPTSAEVAFLVADDLHGLGLGSLLLEHLAARARDHGIRRFTAEVLSSNRAMLGVFVDAGFTLTRSSSEGITDLVMSTSASSAAVAAADQRERRAEARSLHPLLTPRCVAVVGARRDATGVGHAVLGSIREGGFTGTVYAVHPRADRIEGVPAYPTLVDVPEHVDIAMVAVPPAQVLGVVEDAVAAGVSTLVVISSGFSEMGEEGARIQRRIATLARAHSIRVIGPNCLGVMVNDPEIRLNATFTRASPPAGGLAVASQSGGVGIALLDVATRWGLGIGSFISLGNKTDVSGNDLLAAWVDDPRVTAAALYLESFGNAPKFARMARSFSERKPLLGVVGGRSAGGVRAGSSHTAAAATPASGVDALFAQSGVIACRSAEDLAETALLLAEQPLPAGARVGVISNAGGVGVLAADALDMCGLLVPEFSPGLRAELSAHVSGTVGTSNPVDLGAGASADDLAATVELVLGSGEVDTLLVPLVATSVSDPALMLAALVEARASRPELPTVLVPMGGMAAEPGTHPGTTALASLEGAAGAIGKVVKYAAWLAEPRDEVPPTDDDRADVTRREAKALAESSDTGGWLPAPDAAALLTPYGLAPDGDIA